MGCAWGLPGVMVYTAKYGERKNLEETAEAMGVPFENVDTMKLAEALSDKCVSMMKELGIKSIRESGYTLEDCLSVMDQFPRHARRCGNPGIY